MKTMAWILYSEAVPTGGSTHPDGKISVRPVFLLSGSRRPSSGQCPTPQGNKGTAGKQSLFAQNLYPADGLSGLLFQPVDDTIELERLPDRRSKGEGGTDYEGTSRGELSAGHRGPAAPASGRRDEDPDAVRVFSLITQDIFGKPPETVGRKAMGPYAAPGIAENCPWTILIVGSPR